MEDADKIDLDALQSETNSVEFKASFDPKGKQDWCELIKDIVAISNSGGGIILIGVNNDASPSAADLNEVLAVDPADVANKVHSYTEQQLSSFEILRCQRRGSAVALLKVGGSRIPMVFTSPGTYATGDGLQKSAFGKGTIYFRHGPKSEPGTTDDIRAAIERELGRTREFWLDGIGKIVAAPPGTVVQLVHQDVSLRDSPGAAPIRLTTDKEAPAFRAIQPDEIYPFRQKELIARINDKLGPKTVGQYDIYALRYFYKIDEDPTLICKSRWAPRQYSEACLNWMLIEFEKDNGFFKKARDALTGRIRGEVQK